jgi:hypothetical protein
VGTKDNLYKLNKDNKFIVGPKCPESSISIHTGCLQDIVILGPNGGFSIFYDDTGTWEKIDGPKFTDVDLCMGCFAFGAEKGIYQLVGKELKLVSSDNYSYISYKSLDTPKYTTDTSGSIFRVIETSSGKMEYVNISRNLKDNHLKSVKVGEDYVWVMDEDNKLFKCKQPCNSDWEFESQDYVEIG